MGYTTPITASGGVLPSTAWNQGVRDNMAHLAGHAHSGADNDGVHPATFGQDRVLTFALPVPPTAFTGALVTCAYNGSLTHTWDATAKWLYHLVSQTGAGNNNVLSTSHVTTTQLSPRFLVGAASAASPAGTQRLGLAGAALTGDPTNGVYFRCTTTGNWFAVCRAGGVETATDTGVAQSTTPKLFEIVVTPTSVVFKIAGSIVATITTNIPATTALLYWGLGFVNTSGGTDTCRWATSFGGSHKAQSS